MTTPPGRTAIIIGVSLGIGEALARELNREGWCLGLLARRLDRLEALREALGRETVVRRLDVAHSDAATILESVLEECGGADLVVISAGTGHLNRDLLADLDADRVSVNVQGFTMMAQVAMRHFLKRGRGHLVGITSVAALRGSREATAYAASKAFQSVTSTGFAIWRGTAGSPSPSPTCSRAWSTRR
jgi:short-subunit dehydrogenase